MLSEDEKWFAVSLRFVGDGLDPTKLEALLGVAPTTVRIAGQKWSGKQGRSYGPARTNIWSYRSPTPSHLGFEEQIQSLLQKFSHCQDAIRQLAQSDQVEAEIFCSYSSGSGQGGDTLSAQTLAHMAGLGLSLSLDLYPPDSEQVNQDDAL